MLESLLESWNSPPTRHAMLVHMPIALALVGAALAVAAAIAHRNKTCRAIAIACQVAFIVSAFMALSSGESAEAAIDAVLTPEVYDVIHDHQEMADQLWKFGAGALALLGLAAITRGGWSIALGWAAVAVSIVTVGWVGATSNHGGTLVYTYGVGTPQPVACFDLPGERSDGRDHAAEHAARMNAPSPSEAAPPLPLEERRAEGGDNADSAAPLASVAFFRDQVHPLLARRCFNCHNATRVAAGKSGLLDQTSRESLLAGGRSGPAIVPGDPERSILMQRIRGDDPDHDIMPPAGKLPDESIAIIEQWIREGAAWDLP